MAGFDPVQLEALGARLARMLCIAHVKGLTEAVGILRLYAGNEFDERLNDIQEAVVAEIMGTVANDGAAAEHVDLANATLINVTRVYDLLRQGSLD